MRKTNPAISDDEVSKIISEVDLDGDGTINFDGEYFFSSMPPHLTTDTPTEFITMMTGQPYKSPEVPAAASPAEKTDGTQPAVAANANAAAAVRGVSTVSARLQRQRLANQLCKDAWTASDPTLKGTLTPRELLDKVCPLAGLTDVTEADLEELHGVGDEGGITCKF